MDRESMRERFSGHRWTAPSPSRTPPPPRRQEARVSLASSAAAPNRLTTGVERRSVEAQKASSSLEGTPDPSLPRLPGSSDARTCWRYGARRPDGCGRRRQAVWVPKRDEHRGAERSRAPAHARATRIETHCDNATARAEATGAHLRRHLAHPSNRFAQSAAGVAVDRQFSIYARHFPVPRRTASQWIAPRIAAAVIVERTGDGDKQSG